MGSDVNRLSSLHARRLLTGLHETTVADNSHGHKHSGRAVNGSGDTQQKTTTGLAYYRKALNVACFTTGWDHWGLEERGVVHWAGDAVDPPGDATLLP